MVWLNQYYISGKEACTSKANNGKIFFMKIFAKNEVSAKSKFWYFLKKNKKIKKRTGETLVIRKINENLPSKTKNYGIWLNYEYKYGTINVFKEYRDISLAGAVEQMYFEMAGTHRVGWNQISLLRAEELSSEECIRAKVKQFQDKTIKFPSFKSARFATKLRNYSNFTGKLPVNSFLN